MIRRCAKHQPLNPSYGTAARSGERALAYTSWGIGDFQSDAARACGVPDIIYPAFKLLDDGSERIATAASEYYVERTISSAALEALRQQMEAWARERPVSWFSLNERAVPREGDFTVQISDLALMHSNARLYDMVQSHARSLPEAVRPPERAEYTISEVDRNPFTQGRIYAVHWRET